MVAKAVFFDIDGTLVDSNDFHIAAWDEAFRDAGIDIHWNAIHAQIGKGADMLLPALHRAGSKVLLASSSSQSDVDHCITLLAV